MNGYYVYSHTRNDTGKIFYIGKGKGERLRKRSNRRNEHWLRIVNKHGFTPHILLDNLSEDTAYQYEKEFIGLYRSLGYELVNHTDGGEGPSGRPNPRKGIPLTESHKKALSDAHKGHTHSPEVRDKISRNSTGKPRPPRTLEHRRKLAATQQGRRYTRAPRSLEHCRKISERQKQYWSQKRSQSQ